jgi:hypothetical protein
MAANTLANAIENMLRASQLQPPTIDSLKTQYEKATQALGAADFHNFDDIETLVGLEGQFLWSEDPFNFRTITFTFDTDKIGFQGKYKLASGIFAVEEGVFFSLPNNPAIGFAVLTLTPRDLTKVLGSGR